MIHNKSNEDLVKAINSRLQNIKGCDYEIEYTRDYGDRYSIQMPAEVAPGEFIELPYETVNAVLRGIDEILSYLGHEE